MKMIKFLKNSSSTIVLDPEVISFQKKRKNRDTLLVFCALEHFFFQKWYALTSFLELRKSKWLQIISWFHAYRETRIDNLPVSSLMV